MMEPIHVHVCSYAYVEYNTLDHISFLQKLFGSSYANDEGPVIMLMMMTRRFLCG